MATTNDITVIQNDDTALTFTIKQNGTAISLTGSSIAFYIRATLAATDALADFTYSTTNGKIVISTQSGATLGQCVVMTSGTDLAAAKIWHYRLQVTDTSAKKLTYSYGKLKVQDV